MATCMASTRGRPLAPTWASTHERDKMAKSIDPHLINALREESERTKDEPYPPDAKPTRPNRSRVYSVRLSPDEQVRVQQLAEEKHLPPSTLVRSWILDRLEQESA